MEACVWRLITIAEATRTKTLLVVAIVVSAATACTPSVARSQPPPLPCRSERGIELIADSLIPALMRDRQIPGAAVAVLARDTVLFAKGYGVADLATRRPVATSTIFQLASTTKPMTAGVIMRLVEEGKIGLDAPVRQYVAWLPQQYAGITIRQLLTHTSGVRYDLRRENVDEFSLEEFRRRLEASEAAFPPGSRWQYSNTGYTLLAIAAEQVSGKSFGELLRESIFEPLGMAGAGYRVSAPGPEHAIGYDLVDGSLQRAPRVFSGWGNSGVEANVIDVARWVASLSRRSLLRAESYVLMEAAARLRDGSPVEFQFSGEKSSYGFGWFLAKYRGKRLVTHGGAIAGFSSVVNRFDDIAIIVLSNGKQGADRRGQADALATALYDRLTRDTAR
jgi:CubicO group peptidase (beta-lactamase class C family)